MTKVSLRGYNREIESMIEAGRIEEVIAHCQHILKTFPMHVETYRLLGKAFLEARRYTDAVDIFQRVLNAVPDDFVAHVGMSIIRDDEGNVDDAIWHMERAFEIQPSNPAIQGELKRLYGQRDGIEPPKIRLTRDALANMYTQGELYNQAITEIRSVLAEDANRPDLQVMLAQAYYRAGQKVEATEMSMALLKKYPYCLDALRIVVDILPGTGRAEDAQVYRKRVEQMDPYSSFVTDSVLQSDQVTDTAVELERLEYKPGEKHEAMQPSWASSLDLKLKTGTIPGAIPASVTSAEPVAQSPVSLEPPKLAEPKAAQGESAIPDWLRSAGWQEATGEAKEDPSVLAEETQSAEPIAKADIPDWLKDLAPEEATAEMEAPEPDLSHPAAEVPPPTMATPFEEMANEAGKAAGPPPSPMPPFEVVAEPKSAAPIFPEQERLEPGITGPEPEPTIAKSGLPSPEDQHAALAWLEGLAAKQGAKDEELLTRPEERLENPPEWVRREMAGEAAEPAKIELAALTSEPEAEEIPPFAMQEPAPFAITPEPPTSPLIEEATLHWLDSLTAEGSVQPEAQAEAAPKQAAEIFSEAGEPVEVVPEKQEPAEAVPVSKESDVATWLKELEASEAKTVIPSDSRRQPAPPDGEELPDWLRGLARPAMKAEPSKEEELPEWLRASAEATTRVPETPARDEGGAVGQLEPAIPTADENVPIPTVLTPTTPEEWLPAEKVEAAAPEPVSFTVEPAPEPTPPAAESLEPVAESVQPTAEPVPPIPQPALSPTPVLDKDAEMLLDAQTALKSKELNDAMAGYSKLIKKRRLLDKVIHDLRESVYTFPVDFIVWQTLGDAYNRANQLQDALDAYTKAEELLR